ncbi:Probable glutaminyl-tRNA synthetase [Taphrina deformans PYCC 5710]|uniref:glutamine--tRNA ligase n=1 Tax=Taphrina deformans (strain PYCC 5710 / ATCC 11124 / CBS 356.35 / IMI 108563 / JCM 9778 / NBRC 8474) TaxID=1097556 RepID=R4XC27_TAPDE|nr:Probable glutaminyl-tRNA synthetase [Taphrina deformans PYCC 5710]|eukprot:CCG83376.1 Probable glutaminyl-tRNA synthetase [Taphrina deformans PYCC 5710]
MSAEAFSQISLNDKQIAELNKKPKVTDILHQIIHESGRSSADKATGALLLSLANSAAKDDLPTPGARAYIAAAIADGRLTSSLQLESALHYFSTSSSVEIDENAFNGATGVGVIISPTEVQAVVEEYVTKNMAIVEVERYKYQATIMKDVRVDPRLKWANMGDLKPAVDSVLAEKLGPKDERDVVGKKSKAPKNNSEQNRPATTTSTEQVQPPAPVANLFTTGFLGQLHTVGGNPQIKESLRQEHIKACGNRVQTRFPPEPNGYLHIGHSKAITVNFGYARAHDGICYLRFDDTNPEKEEEKYFTAIESMIKWLGFTPYKITYSSDYFQELYELAENLIKRDKAYTCTCTDEQIKKNRGGEERGPRVACVHRDQAIDKSMSEFRGMRAGKYQPKAIILRMKQDLEDGNPQMWDLIAYRVLSTPHHRTGDTWKIYPTYDFTHCLVDSFENITHSLCTTEFVQSRVSYEWLCDALEVYKPAQREYGRLNLQGTVMSKRKIEKLVNLKHVRDWNDPRLYTLVALRRRGVPPGAILAFVAELGVTTSVTNIQIAKFENVVRNYLEQTVPRLMVILEPVKVILENVADDFLEECKVPFNSKDAAMGEHIVPLTKVVYIDRSDFRTVDSKDYFRLAPGKSVGLLKAAYPIRATSFELSETGVVQLIRAHYENDVPFKKPKAYINWVSESAKHGSPVGIHEVRIHHQLFHSDNPEDNPGGFLADINPESEQIVKGAMMEIGYHELASNGPWPKVPEAQGEDDKNAPESIRFQALRVGYFCADSDTSEGKIVLNRIVSLKEDSAKKAIG